MISWIQRTFQHHFRIVFGVMLATMMLPAEANLIVNFVTISRLGLFDTLAGVIAPGVVSGFGIFLMRQAYLVVPGELEDAARLDGATDLQIWSKVMLPLAAPALATLAVFSFVGQWNTFMWPLVILTHEGHFPLAVGLTYLSGAFSTDFRLVAAGSVLSMIPLLAVFLAVQRFFIRGLIAGAVK